jgi:hypothetical protein
MFATARVIVACARARARMQPALGAGVRNYGDVRVPRERGNFIFVEREERGTRNIARYRYSRRVEMRLQLPCDAYEAKRFSGSPHPGK